MEPRTTVPTRVKLQFCVSWYSNDADSIRNIYLKHWLTLWWLTFFFLSRALLSVIRLLSWHISQIFCHRRIWRKYESTASSSSSNCSHHHWLGSAGYRPQVAWSEAIATNRSHSFFQHHLSLLRITSDKFFEMIATMHWVVIVFGINIVNCKIKD